MSNTALRTNLPSGRRCSLVALVALAFAAACSDVKSPIAPPDVKRSDDKSVTCVDPLKASLATDIENAITALYPSGNANQELNNFDAVKKSICGGNSLADGQKKALELVRLLFDDYIKGRFVGPNVAKALLDLVAKIYEFAGFGNPFAAGGPSTEEYRQLLNDGAIGFAQPGQPFQQVANTGNFALKTGNNFFVAPAVVIMFRVPNGSLGEGAPTTYTPVYEVKVFPANAQANFGSEGLPATAPKASIASCVADPHPLRNTLALYQTGSVYDVLPTSSAAILLLSCTPRNYIGGEYLGVIGQSPSLHTPESRLGRLASLLSNGFRFVGRSLLDALTPKSLYAWDGGVGGATGFLDGAFGPVSPTL